MDYEGLYKDVAAMRNRAITAMRSCVIHSNAMVQLDGFVDECEAFLDTIVTRNWNE
jgi:hypothetical protein